MQIQVLPADRGAAAQDTRRGSFCCMPRVGSHLNQSQSHLKEHTSQSRLKNTVSINHHQANEAPSGTQPHDGQQNIGAGRTQLHPCCKVQYRHGCGALLVQQLWEYSVLLSGSTSKGGPCIQATALGGNATQHTGLAVTVTATHSIHTKGGRTKWSTQACGQIHTHTEARVHKTHTQTL
jgi:hypothetical protein